MTFDTFLSPHQVAELLGVSPKMIYRLIEDGMLPATMIGRLYRISESDLHYYLKMGGVNDPTIVKEDASVPERP